MWLIAIKNIKKEVMNDNISDIIMLIGCWGKSEPVNGWYKCGHILSLSEARKWFMEVMMLFFLLFYMFQVLCNIKKIQEWIYSYVSGWNKLLRFDKEKFQIFMSDLSDTLCP